MPTLDVNLFDTRITLKQKKQMAELLTRVVSETLGSPKVEVTIVFRRSARMDVAREGKLGKY